MAYSEAQNKATQKYQRANYDRLTIRCIKSRKEDYEKLDVSLGISLNQLVINLLEAELEKSHS